MSRTDPFQAIADPTRRELLTLLTRAPERSMMEMAGSFDMTLSAVSQHLRVLLEADLVTLRKVGRERRYRLNAAPLRDIAAWLRTYERFWDDRLDHLSAYLDAQADEEKG